MEAVHDGEWRGFAEAHFGGCKLGDRRLTRRAVSAAEAVARHPGGTLPDKLGGGRGGELLGFYRLANNPKVTHAKMLEPHCRVTLAEAVAVPGVVLLVSDTTEADYTGLKSAAGELGQIGNGGGRGLLCHNVLAVDFSRRQALGLASQLVHRRRTVRKGETLRQKREHPGRESRLWKRALAEVPPPPAGQRRVHVCDRGADMFENIEFWESRAESYDIRSKSNRKVVGADGNRHRLHDYARLLPRAGERAIPVSANHGQPARQARVAVAFAAVTLPAPRQKRGEHSDRAARAWVVHVREVDPPAGAAPLEWVLLTNVPVETAADAWERVDWYCCRPMIEEFHKAVKTGCGLEDLQFTTRKALEVAIALLSVVATRLLRLRDLSRDERSRDRPAAQVLDPVYVQVLSAVRFKQRRALTVHEFCMALARLGGHLNRRSEKPPGWLVLWRGWTKLQQMVAAVEADRAVRCA